MTTAPALDNLGSLIPYKNDKGEDQCLGYLMDFIGRGIYDASYGRVEVSKEHADTHNKLLDEAMLKGLDENCQIGQGGTFYYQGKGKVTTFLGTVVSEQLTVSPGGRNIEFYRKGKLYRGRLRKEADCFNFRRVS